MDHEEFAKDLEESLGTYPQEEPDCSEDGGSIDQDGQEPTEDG